MQKCLRLKISGGEAHNVSVQARIKANRIQQNQKMLRLTTMGLVTTTVPANVVPQFGSVRSSIRVGNPSGLNFPLSLSQKRNRSHVCLAVDDDLRQEQQDSSTTGIGLGSALEERPGKYHWYPLHRIQSFQFNVIVILFLKSF